MDRYSINQEVLSQSDTGSRIIATRGGVKKKLFRFRIWIADSWELFKPDVISEVSVLKATFNSSNCAALFMKYKTNIYICDMEKNIRLHFICFGAQALCVFINSSFI